MICAGVELTTTCRLMGGRRLKLFTEQGGKCFYCGAQMLTASDERDVAAEFRPLFCTEDHKHPRVRGGSRLNGSVASCARCNVLKDDMTAEEFITSRRYREVMGLAA